MNIIKEEHPGYFTIMLRKPFKVKILETAIFLILIIILSTTLGSDHSLFKFGAVLSAIITLGLTPIIYKIVVKPKYTLTDTALIIEKNNKETKVPIAKIESLYDIRYFFLINDKKTPLTVSDEFINELEGQIELLKRKK